MTRDPRSGARLVPRRWRGPGPGVTCVVMLLIAVASCGSPDAEEPPKPPTPTANEPTSSSSKPPGSLRLTGTVRTSPEDRLVVLDAQAGDGQPARTWVLQGPVRSLDDGQRVTVIGRADPDADTTTQRGPVFVVESVER